MENINWFFYFFKISGVKRLCLVYPSRFEVCIFHSDQIWICAFNGMFHGFRIVGFDLVSINVWNFITHIFKRNLWICMLDIIHDTISQAVCKVAIFLILYIHYICTLITNTAIRISLWLCRTSFSSWYPFITENIQPCGSEMHSSDIVASCVHWTNKNAYCIARQCNSLLYTRTHTPSNIPVSTFIRILFIRAKHK